MKENGAQPSMIPKRLEQLKRACRSSGLKLTHQRLEIFREILVHGGHPSAEEIHSRVRKRIPTISIDTIYRTLTLLERHRLIARVPSPASAARFEPATTPHHHFFCKNCQEIRDFDWKTFDDLPLPPKVTAWGAVTARQAVVEGVCGRCQEKPKPTQDA